MTTITVPGIPASPLVTSCPPPAVLIDGLRRRDVQVLQWDLLPAPDFQRCLLALADLPAGCGARQLGNMPVLLPVGARVAIYTQEDQLGTPDFDGVVASHRVEVDEGGGRFVAEAICETARQLLGSISSRCQLTDGKVVNVSNVETHFNATEGDLASPSPVAVGGRYARVFAGGRDARRWTVADALGYLIATALGGDIAAPGADELDALAGMIDMGTLDVTEMTRAAAMVEVAHRGGLEIRSGRGGRSLIVYPPGGSGPRRRVSLQPSGTAFNAARSNLARGHVTLSDASAGGPVLALGEHKRYEATFTLAPGWDRGLESPRWRDFIASESSDWANLSQVYRRWVLNEHGWYCDEPWSLPRFDFAAISEQDFTAPSPRRFLPCLSSDGCGQSLGVVVEVRCGAGGQWRRWVAPVWVSGGECAIYLGGDALAGDFFRAAVAAEASVRVTAVVQTDRRLEAHVAGNPQRPTRVLDFSRRCAWRGVHSSSIFHQAPTAMPPERRDDSAMLQSLAANFARASSRTVHGELTLGWIDTSFQPGDIVDRIDGCWVEFSPSTDCPPVVRSVRHEFGRRQCTTITLTG